MIEIPDFWKNISRAGERPFLVHPEGIVTYSDMRALVASATTSLRTLQFAPGERIAILLEDEAKAAAALAAALLEGLVPVMLPHDIGRARLEAICRSIEPVLVVKNDDIFAARDLVSITPPDIPRSNLAYLLFTSGTTATPSGVEITRGNLCSHLDTLIRLFDFGPQTRIFNPTPLAHTDGLIFGPLLALATGGTVIRPGPMRLAELDAWIGMARDSSATHMMTNPTVLSLVDRAAERTDYFTFDGFQGILSGGSQLRRELWNKFEKRFHTRLWNLYGLTETVTTVLYSGRHPEMGPVGTLGLPIDCEARIAPPLGTSPAILEPGVGELQVRGDHIFRGYWRNPERTAATFVEGGWMRTGDLVRRNDDSSYDFLGRVKTAINSGGTLIRGEEIDECLLRHPAVAEVVTVGLPDDEFEEIAVSAVVLGADASEADLSRHCRTELEVLKVPKRIIIVDAIPRGDAGKPNLQSVKEMLSSKLHAPASDVETAGDDVERKLIALAAVVFGVEPSSLSPASSPNTVESWDSFRHVSLILQSESVFDVRIPGDLVGKVSTLAEMISLLKDLMNQSAERNRQPRSPASN